jgi:hypothetical protein
MLSDKGRKGCTFTHIKLSSGQIYARDVSYYDGNKHCHDCGIQNKPGTVHHCGCDWERCPACGGQFIGCECLGEEFELLKYEKK